MVSFTTRALESIKPEPGRRLEIADPLVRGLHLRCSQCGVKSWSFRYRRIDGSQGRDTLGGFPALGIAEARAKALKAAAAVADGRDPAREKQAERRKARLGRLSKPQTLGQLWLRYKATKQPGKRASTQEYQEWLWDEKVEPLLGAHRLADLDRAIVKLAIRKIGASAPTTANRAKTFLSAMLSWACEEELIAANPLARMGRLFAEKSRERVLSDDELRILWKALEAAPGRNDLPLSKRMCAALKLALLTGARGGDVIALHAGEIDRQSKVWVIPADRFKGKRPHTIPLSPAAIDALSEAFDGKPIDEWEGLAFPHGRKSAEHMCRASLTKAMHTLVRDIGMTSACVHDLRRTMATYIASERIGVAPHVISAVLGHAAEGPAVTATYNRHRFDREKRTALEAWATLLAAVVARDDRPSNVAQLRAEAG